MANGMSKAEKEKFEAEQDVRTLVNAAEIRTDKARFSRATRMAKKQLEALKEVGDVT